MIAQQFIDRNHSQAADTRNTNRATNVNAIVGSGFSPVVRKRGS